MPGLSEILRSLYGAYRLARFDAGGLAFLDCTIGGFWRSFFAAVIIAPIYAAMLGVRFTNEALNTTPFRFLAVELIAYVIGWVAFPLLMTTLARVLDREPHYLRYIVAYNWASVWQNILYLPLAILSLSRAVPEGPAGLLILVVLSFVFVYSWFIARAALDIPGLLAIPLVTLDIGLSLTIAAIADSLL